MKTKLNREVNVAEVGLKNKSGIILSIVYCIILIMALVEFNIAVLSICLVFLTPIAINGFIINQTFCKDGIVIHRFLLPNKIVYWNELEQLDITKGLKRQGNSSVSKKCYLVYAKIEQTKQILVMSQGDSVGYAMSQLEDVLKDYPFLMDRFISTGLNDLGRREFEEILAKIKYSYN